MVSEMRWVLAAICLPLLLGIWWWGTRRSRQAPGNAELREASLKSTPSPARDLKLPQVAEPGAAVPEPRGEWGVPPLEPLSILTGDFAQVDVLDLPMSAHPDSLEETFDLGANPHALHAAEAPSIVMRTDVPLMQAHAPSTTTGVVDATTPSPPPGPQVTSPPRAPVAPPPSPQVSPPPRAHVAPSPSAQVTPPRPAASATAPSTLDTATTGVNAQAPNVSETQRIFSIRVCAVAETRWSGPQLLAALEDHGLAFGRYQVFHRRHSDGRTLFCAASLVEPGTFNPSLMPDQEFRGLTLFAVLPGPVDAVQTVDALIQTAAELAQTLQGVVQDSKGVALSQARADAMREEIARFQALLTMA